MGVQPGEPVLLRPQQAREFLEGPSASYLLPCGAQGQREAAAQLDDFRDALRGGVGGYPGVGVDSCRSLVGVRALHQVRVRSAYPAPTRDYDRALRVPRQERGDLAGIVRRVEDHENLAVRTDALEQVCAQLRVE